VGKDNRAATAERAKELRAQQARKERQQKQLIAAAVAVVVVIIAVAIGIVVANNQDSTPAKASDTAFISKVTTIPASVFDTVGAPTDANAVPKKVDGTPLTKDGKPRVIYVGAEFCPYCASERWAMVAALSRFGTFEGLAPTRSAKNDGDIPTVTFTKSTYKSDYLAFDAWETSDRDFKPLQTLPQDVDALFKKYNPGGGIPWTFYGTHMLPGSGIPLEPLLKHTGDNGWNEIADQMAAGTGDVGKSIDASANMISAQVCALTDGQPANVCTSPGVTAAAALIQK